MASLTVASCAIVASSASSLAGVRLAEASPRSVGRSVKMVPLRCQAKTDEEVMKRRAVIAGTAAAVLALVSTAPFHAEAGEPKRGTKEAKKKFANICVSMPTAKVCNG